MALFDDDYELKSSPDCSYLPNNQIFDHIHSYRRRYSKFIGKSRALIRSFPGNTNETNIGMEVKDSGGSNIDFEVMSQEEIFSSFLKQCKKDRVNTFDIGDCCTASKSCIRPSGCSLYGNPKEKCNINSDVTDDSCLDLSQTSNCSYSNIFENRQLFTTSSQNIEETAIDLSKHATNSSLKCNDSKEGITCHDKKSNTRPCPKTYSSTFEMSVKQDTYKKSTTQCNKRQHKYYEGEYNNKIRKTDSPKLPSRYDFKYPIISKKLTNITNSNNMSETATKDSSTHETRLLQNNGGLRGLKNGTPIKNSVSSISTISSQDDQNVAESENITANSDKICTPHFFTKHKEHIKITVNYSEQHPDDILKEIEKLFKIGNQSNYTVSENRRNHESKTKCLSNQENLLEHDLRNQKSNTIYSHSTTKDLFKNCLNVKNVINAITRCDASQQNSSSGNDNYGPIIDNLKGSVKSKVKQELSRVNFGTAGLDRQGLIQNSQNNNETFIEEINPPEILNESPIILSNLDEIVCRSIDETFSESKTHCTCLNGNNVSNDSNEHEENSLQLSQTTEFASQRTPTQIDLRNASLASVNSQDIINEERDTSCDTSLSQNLNSSIYNVSDLIKTTSRKYLQQISSAIQPQGFNETSINMIEAFSQPDDFIKDVSSEPSFEPLAQKDKINEVIVTKIADMKTYSKSSTKMGDALKKITNNSTLIGTEAKHPRVCLPRCEILAKIRAIFFSLNDDLENDRKLVIKVINFKNWCNIIFQDDRLMLVDKSKAKFLQIKKDNKRSYMKFTIVIYLLRKIYALLMTNMSCTKRELYYQVLKFVNKQEQINAAFDVVCCLLDTPPWNLGVISSGKGLVYGNLHLTIKECVISCNIKGGILIPQDLNDIRQVETNACFILIVEKDSIFQKMLDEDLPNKLARPFILITGKGYPDTNTRLFTKKLSSLLKIPMFILVDADPYGIEIMLSYRFGTLSSSYLAQDLALPHLRWVGVHPSEIQLLNIAHCSLTSRDAKKITSILTRPYMEGCPKLRLELNLMRKKNIKAEIEGLVKCNHSLSNFYIPNKLFTEDFI